MEYRQQALRTLALKLNTSGTAEVLDEQKLYQGSYGFIKLQVYVPKTQNTEAPILTAFCTSVDQLGYERVSSHNYRLLYVKEVELDDNFGYLLFERYLPKEFTERATQINGLKITLNYYDTAITVNERGEVEYYESGVPKRHATNLLVSSRYTTTVYPGGWNEESVELDVNNAEAAQISENMRNIAEMQDTCENMYNISIKEISITYQMSGSLTEIPVGQWMDTIPQDIDAFLWTKIAITFQDNTQITAYSVGSTLKIEQLQEATDNAQTAFQNAVLAQQAAEKACGQALQFQELAQASQQNALLAQQAAQEAQNQAFNFKRAAERAAESANDAVTSAIPKSQKGEINGVATLDDAGKVPCSQLPSYVDDVLEYEHFSDFPKTGESGKIYIETQTNKSYRWGGSQYAEISSSLALGETSATAYPGNKGKENADAIKQLQNDFADFTYKAPTIASFSLRGETSQVDLTSDNLTRRVTGFSHYETSIKNIEGDLTFSGEGKTMQVAPSEDSKSETLDVAMELTFSANKQSCTFRLEGKGVKGESLSRTVSISSYFPMFYGTSETTPNSDTIANFSKRQGTNGTITVTFEGGNQYIWFCTTNSINKITAQGFDVPFEQDGTLIYKGGTFKLYRTTNLIVAGTSEFVIS